MTDKTRVISRGRPGFSQRQSQFAGSDVPTELSKLNRPTPNPSTPEPAPAPAPAPAPVTPDQVAVQPPAPAPVPTPAPAAGEPKTRIFRPGQQQAQAPVSLVDDAVVGWVVVIDGPGKGRSFTLSYGMNSIGRNADQRICLDFGDEQISRQGHAMLTYDHRGRRFFLQHGGSANLTYLADAPVLTPVELQGGEQILVGATTLVFVPFCGPDFDWTD